MKPTTKYAKSGTINIAYQVIGDGPIDIVYIPGWVSNIDMMWSEPRLAAFLIRLTLFSRLILFDKRGTGLSDRSDNYSTLEERMDDIRAVMDAANSEKAVLFGHSEGGSVSMLFANTYPQRTISLIGFGIFAKRRYSKDYPWAPTDAERLLSYKMIEDNWADGDLGGLRTLVPSLAYDDEFMNWFASYLRSSASPGAALELQKQNTFIDVTGILKSIKIPTLLLFRSVEKEIKIEEGRYIAARIPNSKLVELSGSDHLFWTGDSFSVLAEIEAFVTGIRPTKKDEIHLKTKTDSNTVLENTMLNNFQYNLKIKEFAELSGRSLSTFKRDFKKYFNTTPSRWLIAKRLEYAKILLQKGELNINQICFESGFKNCSHFIQSFKERYNKTPQQIKTDYSKE